MNGGRADGGWRMKAGGAGGGGGMYGWPISGLVDDIQTNSVLFDLSVWPFAV
jgi:hypothetical protein